ncbi:MAG: AbrB/MazE/SpoVT family DNA-binding domain-containing protein [bacterium]|nr:AbrB/MazE/SpoVT family DNA-binding domain-containing protein [bacterium]
MTSTLIDAAGQIVLPLDWREKFGLKPGDAVRLIETENGLVIIPDVDDDDDLTAEEYAILEARLEPYMTDGKFDPAKFAANSDYR